jgi:hypothetical protein
MLVTSPKGLKYSDGNLAWGRLPGPIPQLAEKLSEDQCVFSSKMKDRNSRDPVAAIEKNPLAERHCICRI